MLVAEDEQHLADLYTDFLTEHYEILTAYGGEAAVEIIHDGRLTVAV